MVFAAPAASAQLITQLRFEAGLTGWTIDGYNRYASVRHVRHHEPVSEISLGNIHIFLALVTVFGLRWPWLWSFVLLTKVTPGVGLGVVRGAP